MSSPRILYSSAPSFRRTCELCGDSYHPASSLDTHCQAYKHGTPDLKPTDEATEHWAPDLSCKCQICPFDIKRLGYRTTKEDPSFEGTTCSWHDQIIGFGSRQPWHCSDIETKKEKTFRVPAGGVIYVSGWDEKGVIFACCIGDMPDHIRDRLWWQDYSRKFRLSNLHHFAEIIGAKSNG